MENPPDKMCQVKSPGCGNAATAEGNAVFQKTIAWRTWFFIKKGTEQILDRIAGFGLTVLRALCDLRGKRYGLLFLLGSLAAGKTNQIRSAAVMPGLGFGWRWTVFGVLPKE